MSPAVAAVIATGDELVNGTSVDTNSAAIAGRLLELGLRVERFVVLGDDEARLASTLVDLGARCAVIVVTGGLGPTLDDVTRSAAARAMGVSLERSEESLATIRAWFESHGRTFAASNERQAWFPRGAEVLPNPKGTAPGFACRVGGARVFALPGPPGEMAPMLEHEVLPRIRREVPRPGGLAIGRFYLFGLSEGVFADRSGPWMDREANPLLGVTAKLGVLSATLLATGADDGDAAGILAARAAEFRSRFAEWIFGEDEPDLAFVVGRALLARKIQVAVAESCTGGLVAARLTRVPGISAVFDRGYVTYSDRAKTELLGVDPAVLARHGAVSGEVAAAMARGAAERSGARVAVAVTGIAGPDGGTAEKPVGLVWFGVHALGATRVEERRFVVRGRDAIREFAANAALDLLRRALPRD
ncbi:MAG: CinA family nicotinamide mononucleotide deamidase-related protein [Planctomycetota bacterium]